MMRYTVIYPFSFPSLFLLTALPSSTSSFRFADIPSFLHQQQPSSLFLQWHEENESLEAIAVRSERAPAILQKPPERSELSRRPPKRTPLKKLPRGAKKEAVKRMEYRSKGAGYLMPCFSTFINHAIDVSIGAEDPVPEDAEFPFPHDLHLQEDLCDQEFHRRVMKCMTGKPTSGIRDGFKAFLDTYMAQYPVECSTTFIVQL